MNDRRQCGRDPPRYGVTLTTALEAAGVEFINGGQPGVRMKAKR
jgi:hypothetical protein